VPGIGARQAPRARCAMTRPSSRRVSAVCSSFADAARVTKRTRRPCWKASTAREIAGCVLPAPESLTDCTYPRSGAPTLAERCGAPCAVSRSRLQASRRSALDMRRASAPVDPRPFTRQRQRRGERLANCTAMVP